MLELPPLTCRVGNFIIRNVIKYVDQGVMDFLCDRQHVRQRERYESIFQCLIQC